MCNVIYCKYMSSLFPSRSFASFAISIAFVCTFLRIPVTMRDESNGIYAVERYIERFVIANNRNNTLFCGLLKATIHHKLGRIV